MPWTWKAFCRGIDRELGGETLGRWSSIPATYAGGAKLARRYLEDVTRLGAGEGFT